MINVMESIRHGDLKGNAKFFQNKRKFYVGKGPPWENESCLMLIKREYLYLIIVRKSIHESKDDTPSIAFNDLIDVWSR